MKKLSLKNIAAACAAGLFLFTMSAAAAPGGTELLTFDSLNAGTDGSPIPAGYGYLNWNNFYALDGVDYGLSGYQYGVISPKDVAFNAYGNPASISSQYLFVLNSAYLTAAWENMQVQVKGYFLNKLVYTRVYNINTSTPTLVRFPPNVLVTDVVFTSSNNSQFAMDNLSVKIIPIPLNK